MAETAGQDTGPAVVEIVDDRRTRIRRPLDLFRLAGLVLLAVLVAVVGIAAGGTARSAERDLARVLGGIPGALTQAVSVLGSLAALALPIVLVIRELVRAHPRRLVEGLVTGLVALGVVGGLDALVAVRPHGTLYDSLSAASHGVAHRPLDAYLAALVALAVVVGAVGEPGWRVLFWICIGGYVVSAFLASQGSALSLVASPALGGVVGLAVRYLAGSPNTRPDGHRLAAELALRGIEARRLERVRDRDERYRCYRATTLAGEHLLVTVFDRDLVAGGVMYGLYRRLRVRAAVAAPPALSMERVAERRSLLALAATAATARIPRFVAGVACGPDAVALVYADPPLCALRDPSRSQLLDLWHNVELLHRARMTHRDLTTGRILVDERGGVILPIPTDGAVFASDLRIGLARAQVLVTTAQLAGVAAAVEAARHVLADDELAATLPLLQPVALGRDVSGALKQDPELLSALREHISGEAPSAPVAPVRVERFRPRTILSIVALIVAGYLIVGQLTSVNLVTVFTTARWGWVPLVLLASATTYLAAALSLLGYVSERLPYWRTVLAQVATSFAGFITPPSVGGIAVNIRYLHRQKISTAGAAVSVSISQAVNAVLHVLLLIALGAVTGASTKRSLPIPGWVFPALGAIAVLVLVTMAVPGPRRWLVRRVVPPLREAMPRLLDLVTSPAKLTQALVGALLLNAAYIAALWFAVRAFGGAVGLLAVAVVYLIGSGVASIAPTPGGLGAVELALSTGLAAAGMPGTAAVSAVLLYRIATFWLPVPVGALAFHRLERQGAL